MKQPRFIMTDNGLILETAIPLSNGQREAARVFAVKTYADRVFRVPAGDRREGLLKVIDALKKNNFMERAIPAYDSDREVILHG